MMTFDEYIKKSWNDHATDAKGVYNTLEQGVALISKNDDIPVFARLINHVCGDHLGLWSEGIEKLQDLTTHPLYVKGTESQLSIQRLVATLKLSADAVTSLKAFSLSDQIRIYALASGQIMERGEAARSKDYFIRSLELAMEGLTKEDPANRALAITGYNLACTLEEKNHRSQEERELMILAAKNSLKYWQVIGGPDETAVGEYRISQSYLKAGQTVEAFEHAQQSIEACIEYNLTPINHFYGYETLAMAEIQRAIRDGAVPAFKKMEESYSILNEDEKLKVLPTLNRIRATVVSL